MIQRNPNEDMRNQPDVIERPHPPCLHQKVKAVVGKGCFCDQCGLEMRMDGVKAMWVPVVPAEFVTGMTVYPLPSKEEFSTGAVRSKLYAEGDRFPARYDLVLRNHEGMRRLAEAFGEGIAKYGRDNWMKGFPESVYLNHALEHIQMHLEGDTSEDHLGHALWNLFTLCWTQKHKPELMDLTNPEKPESVSPSSI